MNDSDTQDSIHNLLVHLPEEMHRKRCIGALEHLVSLTLSISLDPRDFEVTSGDYITYQTMSEEARKAYNKLYEELLVSPIANLIIKDLLGRKQLPDRYYE